MKREFPEMASLYSILLKTHFQRAVLLFSIRQYSLCVCFYICRINSDEYSLNEDCDEQARWRRALQIAEGIEAPPGFVPSNSSAASSTQSPTASTAAATATAAAAAVGSPIWQTVLCHPSDAASFQTLVMNQFRLPHGLLNPDELPRVHSQVIGGALCVLHSAKRR